jgi:hypothetical protein
MEGATTIKVENGELYVRDGTTIIGRKVIDNDTTKYYRADKLHRDDGPAIIIKSANGYSKEVYYKDGVCHREGNLPASITNYLFGVTVTEYFIDGKLHRENGPACITTSGANEVLREAYVFNGEYHRDGGAAITVKHGDITSYSYYTHGKKINVKEIKNNPVRDELRGQFNDAKDEIAALRAALESAQAENGRLAGILAIKNAESTELKQKICAIINE